MTDKPSVLDRCTSLKAITLQQCIKKAGATHGPNHDYGDYP